MDFFDLVINQHLFLATIMHSSLRGNRTIYFNITIIFDVQSERSTWRPWPKALSEQGAQAGCGNV